MAAGTQTPTLGKIHSEANQNQEGPPAPIRRTQIGRNVNAQRRPKCRHPCNWMRPHLKGAGTQPPPPRLVGYTDVGTAGARFSEHGLPSRCNMGQPLRGMKGARLNKREAPESRVKSAGVEECVTSDSFPEWRKPVCPRVCTGTHAPRSRETGKKRGGFQGENLLSPELLSGAWMPDSKE